ncbi:MAG: DUF4012 domain-containing protein [bacterium]|nr:DUF4012 domain-containing protein [bacterium]
MFVGVVFVARDIGALQSKAGAVLGVATQGIVELRDGQDAGAALDFTRAHLSFSLAKQSFTDALTSLDTLHNDVGAVARIIPFERSARQALVAARELSDAGKVAAATGDALPRATAAGAPFVVVSERLSAIAGHLTSARTALHDIPTWSIVGAHSDEIKDAQKRLDDVALRVDTLRKIAVFLNQVFGGSTPKRYLVFFQNDAEMRATGGFWGSFALVDFADGKLVKAEIPDDGSYVTQGSLRKRVAPPLPLAYLRDRWELQDANWFFDLPTSSRTAQDFFAWSGGSSVDGVVTINAQLLPELLEIVGPVALPGEQKVLTSSTVLFELQKSVELEPRKDGEGPKSILQSLGPRMLEKLFTTNADALPKLLDVVVTALRDGDIQFALNDDVLAEQARQFGWDGSVPDVSGDFLAVVDTNIAGGKTDTVITEDITHDISFLNEGSAAVLTTVTRAHAGSPDAGPFIGVVNRDFMRIFVPTNAQVVDVRGFAREPDLQRKDAQDTPTPDGLIWDETIHAYRGEESGKLVIAGWIIVKPGEKESVSVRTLLSSPVDQGVVHGVASRMLSFVGVQDETSEYRFFFKPQSGKTSGSVTVHLTAPDGWNVVHVATPEGVEQYVQQEEMHVRSGIGMPLTMGVILKRL